MNMGCFIRVLLLIGLTVLGGFLGGVLYDAVKPDIADIRWQRIPDPPEKPSEIVEMGGLGSNAERVLIKTVSGTYFECCVFSASWKEATERMRTGESCATWTTPPLDEWSGRVLDCAHLTQWEWVTEQHYVVILVDGSLWRWRFYEGMTVLARFVGWGLVVGFFVGALVVFGPNRSRAT